MLTFKDFKSVWCRLTGTNHQCHFYRFDFCFWQYTCTWWAIPLETLCNRKKKQNSVTISSWRLVKRLCSNRLKLRKKRYISYNRLMVEILALCTFLLLSQL